MIIQRLRSVQTTSYLPLLLAGCLLTGCHHRPVQPLVLPQSTPVPLATDNSAPPVLQTPAKPQLPEVPVASAASKPKRLRKKTPKPAPQTASGVTLPASVGAESGGGASRGAVSLPAAAAETSGAETHVPVTEAAAAGSTTTNREVASIGALTAGDVQNPNARREVTEMIAANERRLAGLPADTVRSQAALVSKVRTFQKDAQQALDSGDADGAKSLALKGKLLLDDLTKPLG